MYHKKVQSGKRSAEQGRMIPNPGARARVRSGRNGIQIMVVALTRGILCGARTQAVVAGVVLALVLALVLGCAGMATPCPTELTTYIEGGGGSAFGDRATDVRGGVSLTWDLTGAGCGR